MNKTVEEQISEFLSNSQENIKAAYLKGYKNGLNDGNINDRTFAAKVKEAYNNGLNDGWECAKKIVTSDGLEYDDLEKIFGYRGCDPIFENFSASEAVTKIKEYEGRQKKTDDEIHVGDEVYAHDKNVKKIVLGITDYGNFAVLSQNGNFGVFSKGELHKTGRKYPIMEILEKLNQLNESEG